MSLHSHLILDFEATCSNDGTIPRSEMEIIEIGAVILNAQNLEIISEFQSFIKPLKHPVLTPFCTQLTHISQENVSSSPSFPKVINNFKNWLSNFNYIDFSSWGQYDFNQLNQDCEFHKIENPIAVPHRNLKLEFSQFLKVKKGYGLGKALKRLHIEFEGTHHRALDDTKNIVKILKYMMQKN